ncbi:hypothetical protein AVEN_252586-1 [Araneus ventricosus]|uniref:Uncharacterized protein n=1 Tax=Araneus ventricosus TaxID=182803 RepID=A0A4Y2AR74_ARAVE|nr:hypothetical protein AVEN_252586-1 [Araneus ventricosus]
MNPLNSGLVNLHIHCPFSPNEMTLSLNYSREGVTSLDNRFWTSQRVGGTAEEHESEEKGFGFYLLIVIGFWVTVGSNIFIPAEGGETAPFWGSMRKFRGDHSRWF